MGALVAVGGRSVDGVAVDGVDGVDGDGASVPRPAERSVAELAREIRSGAVRLAAATAVWLRLVAEFDAREGWGEVGVQSCAHWLAWQCGMSPGAAREHVRVARALGSLPVTAEAFAAGRLSYSKVRAISRVADPGTEVELVELARHATASQVERVVRAWRRSDAVDEGRVAEKRSFQWHWDADGMLVLQVRMDGESGAALLAAVESLAERDARRERAAATRAAAAAAEAPIGEVPPTDPTPTETGTAGCPAEPDTFPRERMSARRCRALAQLAEVAADTGRRAGDPPRREVVVHVDADVLADDAAAGRAHLEGGPALAPAQVRRMVCEASLTVIVERNGQPLALGRRRRLATRAQRRALSARDGGCARPGCTETRIERLHAHHLTPWRLGGRTDVSAMVLLCDVDHGLVHDEGLVLDRRGRELVAHDRGGQPVWGPPDPAFGAGLAGEPAEAVRPPLTLVSDAPLPGAPLPDAWPAGGERMDLGHVVWALLAHRDHLRRTAS
ncbi:HNH endonuclease signature motif containing protein [uncultured Modestobacter sp.]|uniref:HNH endonuclease signature motif containing protein n=1 Tax=uncultured Modestobacter sp. TaxID=380048 RepID=UPI00262969E0|nr:HNH endonuclease signature motif containing protein [uncultured Modestobacter sp.]